MLYIPEDETDMYMSTYALRANTQNTFRSVVILTFFCYLPLLQFILLPTLTLSDRH
jgi:hypothetical protein